MSPYGSYLVETLITLMAVCAIAFAVLYGARRLGIGRSTGGIELVGRLPLDARRSIVLVRVGAHVFIVGVGDGGFTKLGRLPASEVPAGAPAESPAFAAVLARVLGQGAAQAKPKKDQGGA
jgi:flagellar biogenesis protein FliO